MNLLCQVCDRLIIENESEYNQYLATMRKKDDKSFNGNFIINDVNLDEGDESLDNYVTTHNEKLYYCLVRSEFVLEFDINFTTNIQTNYCYKMDDITKKNGYLIYWIDLFKSRGYKFYNINQMTNKSISVSCNMTYKH